MGKQEIKLSFSFPDVITVGHYETYMDARLRYIEDRENPTPNIRAQYEGALAVLKAGIVHVSVQPDEPLANGEVDPDVQAIEAELKRIIHSVDQSQTPASIMNLIGSVVAAKIEVETNTPFLSERRLKATITPQSTEHREN
jgi:hypothetical protein